MLPPPPPPWGARIPTSSTAPHLDYASGSSVVAGLDLDGPCMQSSMRRVGRTPLALLLDVQERPAEAAGTCGSS